MAHFVSLEVGSCRFNNHLNLYDPYAQKTYDRIGNTEIA